MPKFNITMPVTLALAFEVEADDEADAMGKAFDHEWSLTCEGADVVECESHEQIVQGNVFYGCINDMEIERAHD